MADEIRISRQAQAQAQVQQPSPKPDMSMHSDNAAAQQTNSKAPWIILAVVVAVIIILGVLFRDKLFKGNGGAVLGVSTSQPSGYQAVFLTNGQVYFGKLSNAEGNYITLDDIYYLQVGPAQGNGPSASSTPANQNITLVKLGNELHGPVDEMHISRSQVLFYEDLKNDGNVVSAILKDKASKTAPPAAK